MKFARFICPLVLLAVTTVLVQSNPVPLANQPLVPTATVPGGPPFVLAVNGTGFVSTSTIKWNGTLSTTFVSSSQLTATVPVEVTMSACGGGGGSGGSTGGGTQAGTYNLTVTGHVHFRLDQFDSQDEPHVGRAVS
jgi:hypothetical protein